MDSRAHDPTGCRLIGSAVLGAAGVGLLGSAMFRTDPVSGYPLGTANVPTERTAMGAMHDIAALPIFLGFPVGALMCAWRFQRQGRRGWALYSAVTSMSMAIATGLFGAGFGQKEGLVNLAGLFQRIAITIGFGWLTGLSVQGGRNIGRALDMALYGGFGPPGEWIRWARTGGRPRGRRVARSRRPFGA